MIKKLFLDFCSLLSSIIDFIRRRIIYPPKNSVNWRPKYHYTWGMTKTNYHYFVDDEIKTSYDHFKKYFLSSVFYSNSTIIRNEIIKKAIKNDTKNLDNNFETKFYLEFGVFNGQSTNIFAKQLKRHGKEIFAFDSFEGLYEDQLGHLDNHAGQFNKLKKIPELDGNVKPVTGWIQDTLPKFISENFNDKSKVKFIHIDVDTYETTKFILINLKKYLEKDTIILFDELYNMPGWSVSEYKALKEVFSDEEYTYIGFAAYGEQAAIKIN